jgi:hypothetical protein
VSGTDKQESREPTALELLKLIEALQHQISRQQRAQERTDHIVFGTLGVASAAANGAAASLTMLRYDLPAGDLRNKLSEHVDEIGMALSKMEAALHTAQELLKNAT